MSNVKCQIHIPVLQKEVIQFLAPKPNENFIDCTIGEAGHTLAILEKNGPKGKVLGIEWDPELYKQLKEKCARKCARFYLAQRVVLVNDSFINLKEIVKREKFGKVAGILFDLGLSNWHLEKSGRGFSFLRDEPLDMRYQTLQGQERDRRGTGEGQERDCPSDGGTQTAEKIVNEYSENEIEKILREYGEEKFPKSIAKEIVEVRKIRPIKTTFQLVEIIKKATPKWYHRQRIHPATRTFQALRIIVNDELNNIEKALPQALEILEPKGRLVLISFHSLEDRIVKNFFKNSRSRLKILTKKPISPSVEEIKINPRSRSAKLRAAVKL